MLVASSLVHHREETPDLSNLASVYFGVHLAGGHIGLPILVLLFLFSKRVQRPMSVINFCITWIVYSVSYCLIIYGGHHHTLNPPFKLCLVQASMIHGAPPMAAVAGLEVVLQAWTTFILPWQRIYPAFVFRMPRWLLFTLIVAPPYVVFVIFAIAAAFVALRQPETVLTMSSLHCTIPLETSAFQRFAVPLFCAVLLTTIVMMEVIMIVQYFRGWRLVRKICPLATRKPSLSPWFRVTVFTLYSAVTSGACITYLSDYISSFPYVIQATLPLVATLIFGSQSDILHVCGLRKLSCKSDASGDSNEIEYTPGGGWSGTVNAELSPQLTGHVSFASEARAHRADENPVVNWSME